MIINSLINKIQAVNGQNLFDKLMPEGYARESIEHEGVYQYIHLNRFFMVGFELQFFSQIEKPDCLQAILKIMGPIDPPYLCSMVGEAISHMPGEFRPD